MAQSVWHSRWLAWLDDVQAASARRSFPEDPELAHLHAWFTVGLSPAEAVAELRALRTPHNHARRGDTL